MEEEKEEEVEEDCCGTRRRAAAAKKTGLMQPTQEKPPRPKGFWLIGNSIDFEVKYPALGSKSLQFVNREFLRFK